MTDTQYIINLADLIDSITIQPRPYSPAELDLIIRGPSMMISPPLYGVNDDQG